MSFLDLTSELTGVLPGLSPFLADTYVNNAWIDICNRKPWSWLRQDAAVFCPAQITAGTVAIVRGTATITASAAASAALAAQQATALPTLTNMQIRFGASTPAVGQVYSIIGYDATDPNAVILTLDRVVVEATNAASGYQCYRCYVTPPVASGTMLAWLSFTDMVNGWTLKRDFSSAYFDAKDPQRQAQGMAYYLGSYEGNRVSNIVTGATVPNPNLSAGVPSYELWPHPTSGQTFYVRMKLKGARFIQPTQEIPTNVVDSQLIMHRALGRYAYPFAMAQASRIPAWKGLNLPTLIRLSNDSYDQGIMTALRLDEEQASSAVTNRGHGLRGGGGIGKGLTGFPIDSNFIQSHLLAI